MFQNTPWAGTSTFKIILGLGLCTLGGTMLYMYFKNSDDEEEDKITGAEIKKTASIHNNNKEILIKVDVTNEQIPLIIGRGGTNLSLIEERTGTKLEFCDKDDNHKYCVIKGMPDAVKEARALMLKEIERSPIIQEELLVPQSVCGKIMGRCGEAMQEICRASLAKVSVDAAANSRSNSALDKRRITITGNRYQVGIARKLIEEKISEDEDLRRVVEEVEQNREPRRSPTNSINSSMYSSQTSLSSHLPPREKLLSARTNEKPMEVYVSAIASPAKFWIQLIGPQTKKLDDMVQAMTSYYSVAVNREMHEIKDPYLGQIVAAIFKYDGKWYRAEIVGILPNQYNANEIVLDLYFVDYGDSEYVALNEVFELRTDFLTLRFQAVECFLANVKTTLDQESETWQPQSIQKFEELTQVANWKKLIARVTMYKERPSNIGIASQRETSPIPGVELFDCTEGVDVNLGHILISHGFALPSHEQQRSHSPYFSSPENVNHSNPATPTTLHVSYEHQDDNYNETSTEDAHMQHQLTHLQQKQPYKNSYFNSSNGNNISDEHLSDKVRTTDFLTSSTFSQPSDQTIMGTDESDTVNRLHNLNGNLSR